MAVVNATVRRHRVCNHLFTENVRRQNLNAVRVRCGQKCPDGGGEDGRKPIAIPPFSVGRLLCDLDFPQFHLALCRCRGRRFQEEQIAEKRFWTLSVSTPSPRESGRPETPRGSKSSRLSPVEFERLDVRLWSPRRSRRKGWAVSIARRLSRLPPGDSTEKNSLSP